MTDDDTITLKQAAEIYSFKVSTLRAEHGKGRLTLYRIGNKDYTTPADIKEMVRQCRVDPKGHDFILTRDESSGSSGTDRVSSALAAARETTLRLRNSSRNTSDTSTSRRHRARQ
jgi:hypothetical protein